MVLVLGILSRPLLLSSKVCLLLSALGFLLLPVLGDRLRLAIRVDPEMDIVSLILWNTLRSVDQGHIPDEGLVVDWFDPWLDGVRVRVARRVSHRVIF